jgi:hypothetical protein
MRLSRLLVIIFRDHIPGKAGMGGSCIASEFDEVGARHHALRVYDHIVALPVVDDQGVCARGRENPELSQRRIKGTVSRQRACS